MSTVQAASHVRSSTSPNAGSQAGSDSHFVERGETLSQIAAEHGVSVEAMLRANPQIRDRDLIFAGDRLRVPAGGGNGSSASANGTHVVQRGDTLSQLARIYDTDIATLVRLNGIRNPDLIHVNQRLHVPGGGSDTGGGVAAPGTGGGGGGGGGNWMQIARGEKGQSEIAGSRDNARIVEYHQTTSLRANDDETPWCASFVNWTLEKAGYKGTDSAAAISWATWGDKVNGGLANGREGDVVVIRNRSSGQNHVGFLVRSEGGSFTLLGGNQSNTVKESTYGTGSYEVLAVRRPPGTDAPAAASPSPSTGGSPQTGLTEAQYAAVARDLGVDVAAIKAVAEVEASGNGFLPSGKPKILFEAHVFARETGGRYNGSHPNLSSPSWNRSLYGAAGEHQWDRFEAAYKLDPEAAIKAASWGRFQIMGFNHQRAGYDGPQAFVQGMKAGEGKHLEAFASFIKSDPAMLRALRDHDWAAFAYRYNGAGYAQNQYDTKIAAAYARHAH